VTIQSLQVLSVQSLFGHEIPWESLAVGNARGDFSNRKCSKMEDNSGSIGGQWPLAPSKHAMTLQCSWPTQYRSKLWPKIKDARSGAALTASSTQISLSTDVVVSLNHA
jgi:hypothetical protein